MWGYLLLWGGGSLLMFTKTRSHYITQAGLKVMILLSSWPHKCEDFQCILPHMHMSGFFFFLVYTYLLSIPQPFMFFFLSFKKNSRAKKWKTVNIPKYKQNIIIMLCFFKVILGGIFYYIWFQEGGEPFLLLSTMEKLRSQINYEPKVIRKKSTNVDRCRWHSPMGNSASVISYLLPAVILDTLNSTPTSLTEWMPTTVGMYILITLLNYYHLDLVASYPVCLT